MLRDKKEASISIFLALTITLMLSFCMILIESARENTLLLKADVAMDAGIKSVMADYYIPLWDEFDVLYLDCSYNTSNPGYELVKDRLKQYIERNLKYGNKGWLEIQFEEAKISDVLLATDYGGKDFYDQAIQTTKTDIGISYVEEILKWFRNIEENVGVGESFQKDVSELSEKIEEENGAWIEVEDAIWGYDLEGNYILLEDAKYEEVNIENPLERILSASMLTRQIIPDFDQLSEVRVSLAELVSGRTLAAGTKMEVNDEDSILDKIFFCKYTIDHFSNYRDAVQKEINNLQYQIEYIIGGKPSDKQNLEIVISELLLIREIDNYFMILQDDIKKLEAHEIAVASTATLVPWLEPVVYQATLLYWAYEESVQDLKKLFLGEKIPLVKVSDVFSEVGLGYKEYLMLLLLMKGQETLVMRSMDLIELELRKEYLGFRMDACISKANIDIIFVDAYKKKYMVSGMINYD